MKRGTSHPDRAAIPPSQHTPRTPRHRAEPEHRPHTAGQALAAGGLALALVTAPAAVAAAPLTDDLTWAPTVPSGTEPDDVGTPGLAEHGTDTAAGPPAAPTGSTASGPGDDPAGPAQQPSTASPDAPGTDDDAAPAPGPEQPDAPADLSAAAHLPPAETAPPASSSLSPSASVPTDDAPPGSQPSTAVPPTTRRPASQGGGGALATSATDARARTDSRQAARERPARAGRTASTSTNRRAGAGRAATKAAAGQDAPHPGTGPHVLVREGDCLWSITQHLLQEALAAPSGARTDTDTTREQPSDAMVARAWPRLYAHNLSRIGADPALIIPGTSLAVPDDLYDVLPDRTVQHPTADQERHGRAPARPGHVSAAPVRGTVQ